MKFLTNCPFVFPVVCFVLFSATLVTGQQPGFETGIKIGEVTQTSAVVWARLTTAETPVHKDELNTTGPEVNGMAGKIGLEFWSEGNKDDKKVLSEQQVQEKSDYACQFELKNLKPNTSYNVRLVGSSESSGTDKAAIEGSFKTAPEKSVQSPVKFAVVTGQGYHRRDEGSKGHKIYNAMMDDELSFFVHTGDIVYYDRQNPKVSDLASARFHWQRMYSLPNQVHFHRQVPSYFIKDDHDTLKDDCWPGMTPTGTFTFDMGIEVFREQVPMSKLTYRTFQWGKDVQIWLMEGRDFRSVNRDPDGPKKTIWGTEQINWLKETAAKSDATFKVLISPTPIVGPDRKNKNDNHANDGFKTEGEWVRRFLSDNGFIVICGDRHWQYVSHDPTTGLIEFATGPTSNRHAGGFNMANRTDAHKFLRIKGGYFVASISRSGGEPTFIGSHFSVDGEVVNTVSLGTDLKIEDTTADKSR